jgi:hypothetical protein
MWSIHFFQILAFTIIPSIFEPSFSLHIPLEGSYVYPLIVERPTNPSSIPNTLNPNHSFNGSIGHFTLGDQEILPLGSFSTIGFPLSPHQAISTIQITLSSIKELSKRNHSHSHLHPLSLSLIPLQSSRTHSLLQTLAPIRNSPSRQLQDPFPSSQAHQTHLEGEYHHLSHSLSIYL